MAGRSAQYRGSCPAKQSKGIGEERYIYRMYWYRDTDETKGEKYKPKKKERRKEKKIKEKLTERNPIVASKARPGTLTIFKSMSAGVTPTLLAGDVESMTE